MSAKSHKNASRAPRYVLRDNDAKTIRFTSSKSRKIILSELIDFSETGAAFSTSNKLCPRLGETIKLDFAPPGSFQIAVEGRVVRIEEPTYSSKWARFPGMVKVGVVFNRVPTSYKNILSSTITSLLEAREEDAEKKSHTENKARKQNVESSWASDNAASIVITTLLLALFIGGLYYFLNEYQPAPSSQNSDWAQGFFKKIIPPPNRK